MVFLAVTREGLAEAIIIAKPNNSPVWCGVDAITDAEYEALEGVNLSRFNYPLSDESFAVIQDAIDTITEHYPDERIWIEQQ